MSNEHTITLTYRQLVQLQDMYLDILEKWDAKSDTDRLLYAHAREMEKVLRVKLAKEVSKPRLVLKESEVRAFWLLWQMIEIEGSQYQQVMINELLTEADKFLKQPAMKMIA